MTLFLSKLVPPFLYPLGLAILLIAGALILGQFRRFSRWLLLLAIALLWLSSMPLTADYLALRWEAAYPPIVTAKLPQADAIVLLGGFIQQPEPPRIAPDLTNGVDRLFEAARLFHAGKAAHIIVSAGNLPWSEIVAPEADWIGRFLVELGVPTAAIVLETRSRNTRENALFSADILNSRGWQSVLLVTSADHMRRAMATFRKVGIQATAAPTDVQARAQLYVNVFDLLPSADALVETSAVLKEMIGLVYYRLRGWA